MVGCDSSTSHTWNSANQTQCMPLLVVSSQVCVECLQIRLFPFSLTLIEHTHVVCILQWTLVFVIILKMIYLPSYPTLMSMVNTVLQPSYLVFEEWQGDTFFFCSCGLSENTEDFILTCILTCLGYQKYITMGPSF